MEKKEDVCLKPEFLSDTPGKCSPEQIRRCHGEGADHPCVPAESDSAKKQNAGR